jgi:hypothetical protein
MLIANCAILQIPADCSRLFDGDEDYEVAMWAVVERVAEHNRREQERAERRAH